MIIRVNNAQIRAVMLITLIRRGYLIRLIRVNSA